MFQLFSQRVMSQKGSPYNRGLELLSYRHACKETPICMLPTYILVEAILLRLHSQRPSYMLLVL